MLILASRMPMLFPLPTGLFPGIFAWLVSAFRSQLKGHFLGEPPLSTPQKPPAALTCITFFIDFATIWERSSCLLAYVFPSISHE